MPARWLALPHHRQETPYTCTPACVRMVLEFFGLNLQEAEITRLLETDGSGTVLGRIANVEPLGFAVSVGPGTFVDIQAAFAEGLPVIAPVKTLLLPNNGPPDCSHCVVVAGATRAKVAICDPEQNSAPDVLPATVFQAAWKQKQNRMAVLKPINWPPD